MDFKNICKKLYKVYNIEQQNAHKFEMPCVDMIELADNCLPFEVEREKEFAPIKNKTGVDSVESAQALLEKKRLQIIAVFLFTMQGFY